MYKALITVLLFILLSPGLLLNIPGLTQSGNFWDLSIEGTKYFQTHQTSFLSIVVHGIIFAIACWLLNKTMEGFLPYPLADIQYNYGGAMDLGSSTNCDLANNILRDDSFKNKYNELFEECMKKPNSIGNTTFGCNNEAIAQAAYELGVIGGNNDLMIGSCPRPHPRHAHGDERRAMGREEHVGEYRVANPSPAPRPAPVIRPEPAPRPAPAPAPAPRPRAA